ncbi:MAG: CHAT domain-containing protein [Sphaerospermopsis sp. SIO1G1]|nr:CHAT domain-containing protein [Sphaerospermopsis sp. SIO1G1]
MMSKYIKYVFLGCLSLILVLLQLSNLFPVIHKPVLATVTTQVNSPTDFVKIGKQRYQREQFVQAIALWQQALDIFIQTEDKINQAAVLGNMALAHQKLGKLELANQTISKSINLLNQNQNPQILAEILNIQGSLQLSQGEAENALNNWKEVTNIYQKIGDQNRVNRSLLNQTQALRVLGLYPQSRKVLEQVNENLQTQPDSQLKVATLLNLGDTWRVIGNFDAAQDVLQQSLEIARKINSPADIDSSLLSLGNAAFAQEKNQDAIKYYQQVIENDNSDSLKLKAQLNLLQIFINTQEWQATKTVLGQIQPQLDKLPVSRTQIYAQVKVAQSLQKIGEKQTAAKILSTAIQTAKTIGDQKSQSYGLGYLGQLYEENKQWQEAQKLTEQALGLSQSNNAGEISYLWQWQLGRIYQAIGNSENAINAYDQAVKTLGFLRKDLVASNSNLQFSFQESIEPIYRELVSLLLENQQTKKSKDIEQENLVKARDLIESLKIAELDNYFQEDCLSGKRAEVDQVDPHAALIYPIILSDRLEVIISLTNQPLHHYSTPIPQAELEKLLQQMRSSLRPNLSNRTRLRIAQKTYNVLIKPTETYLAANNIKTLVFVLDGTMKNIPMAALYDGEKYLIEKYSLAQTPGLQLLSPQPLQNQKLNILVAGISEARQGFTPLPGVEVEVEGIQSEISTQVLFNEEFTTADIENVIRETPFPIIHFATHGQFSSDAEKTFILTWDNRINVKELGELLELRDQDANNPIELLVLSACQTAQGDRRAPLGIAGVAVRSGARSTLATLWSVDDQSAAEFMVEFYRQLAKSKITKAEAIRLAQLKLLQQPKYRNPFYWAPFVLLGNWL